MPTRSAKQERFMQAVAHDPKFAKKAGVPQSVGKEFTKFAEGGVPPPPEQGGVPRVNEALAAEEAGMSVAEYRAARAAKPAQSNIKFDKPVPRNLDQRDKLLKSRGFAAGGSIDGCAQRGKTRAKRS